MTQQLQLKAEKERRTGRNRGCQMAHFHTKNPQFDIHILGDLGVKSFGIFLAIG
jgi:hypothetical protein